MHMASNFNQPGDVLTLTAPSGGVVSGVGYVINGLFVVALNTAAQGEQFEGKRSGVFTMAKATHATTKAFAEGEVVFWDNGVNKRWDKTATGLFQVGVAAKAAGSTAATVEVLINPTVATAVSGG
jgi:predicted RecA/RadA family phage recombinase